jgi:class 3 adenylate cyclase
MEEAAKAHGVACVISGDVTQALGDCDGRLVPIGHEKIRGLTAEIPIFEYRVDPKFPQHRQGAKPMEALARLEAEP